MSVVQVVWFAVIFFSDIMQLVNENKKRIHQINFKTEQFIQSFKNKVSKVYIFNSTHEMLNVIFPFPRLHKYFTLKKLLKPFKPANLFWVKNMNATKKWRFAMVND